MLSEVLAWTDSKLDKSDDCIQWLFPPPEPSPFNPSAPAPSVADFAELAKDEAVKAGVARAGTRLLQHLGLEFDGTQLTKAKNWPERSATWLPWPTPKDRHVSRMLRCSSLLGFTASAMRVLQQLEPLVRQYRGPKAQGRLAYWRHAVDIDQHR